MSLFIYADLLKYLFDMAYKNQNTKHLAFHEHYLHITFTFSVLIYPTKSYYYYYFHKQIRMVNTCYKYPWCQKYYINVTQCSVVLQMQVG